MFRKPKQKWKFYKLLGHILYWAVMIVGLDAMQYGLYLMLFEDV